MWWIILIGFFGLLQLVYRSEWFIAAFHRRRVRIYFGTTHIKRHEANYQVQPAALTLPSANEVVTMDYRDAIKAAPIVHEDGRIRIVSWNIELGYKLPEIVARLRTMMPIDVLLLQECDIICDGVDPNSNKPALAVDCVRYIAKQLQMTAVFTGSYQYRFGTTGAGIWGSAVLSRWPLSDGRPIITKTIIADYPKPSTVATLDHPTIGKILCYSIHLEACSGIVGRIDQFNSVIRDWHQRHNDVKPGAVIIGGDFNTLGSGMARISPVHCRDHLRWRTLFTSEPLWWQRRLFSRPGQPAFGFTDPFDKSHKRHFTLINNLSQSKYDWILTNGLTAVTHAVGNTDDSDHWWVSVDALPTPIVPPHPPSSPNDFPHQPFTVTSLQP